MRRKGVKWNYPVYKSERGSFLGALCVKFVYTDEGQPMRNERFGSQLWCNNFDKDVMGYENILALENQEIGRAHV